MDYKEYIIAANQKAANQAFNYAINVPADKLDWKPLDNGRSVLNISQELAKCPDWAINIITEEKFPDWTEETQSAYDAERAGWTTAEICKIECDARLKKLASLIRNFPSEKLNDKIWLPFDGGRDFTVMEIFEYPQWNFSCHEGQIAYIQTLYGDTNMY